MLGVTPFPKSAPVLFRGNYGESCRKNYDAEMLAAQRFNEEKGNNIHCVYGVTTSGTDWLFLKLEGQKLHIDMGVYAIGQCDKILGILSSMVSLKA